MGIFSPLVSNRVIEYCTKMQKLQNLKFIYSVNYLLSARHGAGNWERSESRSQNRCGTAHMELTIQ